MRFVVTFSGLVGMIKANYIVNRPSGLVFVKNVDIQDRKVSDAVSTFKVWFWDIEKTILLTDSKDQARGALEVKKESIKIGL